MLKTFSYLNLIFAVSYFLGYLQNGGRLAILGLLTVVVYNWLVLLDTERRRLRLKVLRWILAFPTFLFALFIGYGDVVLLLDSIDHQYYPWGIIVLITFGLCFAISIIFHLFASIRENYVKKDE